jgi:ElaB/YqjD/DUF883 family membrane-anchored ribosome-binding protein
MTSSTKAHSGSDAAPDLDTLREEFAEMRHTIEALAAKLKSDVGNGASGAMHDAASQLSDRATHLYENLASQGKRTVKAVSDQVEEQPLASVVVAFAVGFVASKLLWR